VKSGGLVPATSSVVVLVVVEVVVTEISAFAGNLSNSTGGRRLFPSPVSTVTILVSVSFCCTPAAAVGSTASTTTSHIKRPLTAASISSRVRVRYCRIAKHVKPAKMSRIPTSLSSAESLISSRMSLTISEMARDVSVEPKMESSNRMQVSANPEMLVRVDWPSSKAVERISSASEMLVLKVSIYRFAGVRNGVYQAIQVHTPFEAHPSTSASFPRRARTPLLPRRIIPSTAVRDNSSDVSVPARAVSSSVEPRSDPRRMDTVVDLENMEIMDATEDGRSVGPAAAVAVMSTAGRGGAGMACRSSLLLGGKSIQEQHRRGLFRNGELCLEEEREPHTWKEPNDGEEH
jgi:hypothetical protein